MMRKNEELVKRFYELLYLIRKTEEEIIRIYPTDKIKSPVHLSIGQEAISVGICQALMPEDVVFGTYRGHAMYLAKGGSLKRMIAELYGKETGCAQGKGGSMHLIDIEKNILGTSAIVGTTIPLSVGFAYGIKYRKLNSIAVTFFGDGAVDEGAYHESMNFAALKKLPVLFVCENNLYAIHSHYLKRHKSDNIIERARSYGMPAVRIKDDDIFNIHRVAKEYVSKIRKGDGPMFIECLTCRWKEHVGPNDDFHLGYRSEKAVSICKEKDALKQLKKRLGEKAAKSIELKAEAQIKEAFDFAEKSRFPKIDELYTDIFKK